MLLLSWHAWSEHEQGQQQQQEEEEEHGMAWNSESLMMDPQ